MVAGGEFKRLLKYQTPFVLGHDVAGVVTGFGSAVRDFQVLDSRGGENLERSLTVLKPGGQAISVSGPPDPGFAKQLGAPKLMGVVMGLLSRKVRKQARKLGVSAARSSSRPTDNAAWAPG
jgi:NADPH:quinone reductase-like Zn-dependent oxidoreductase